MVHVIVMTAGVGVLMAALGVYTKRLPLFDLATKVARRRHFSKTKDADSIPAASTRLTC